MNVSPTTWLEWLKTNQSNPWYDANVAKVRDVGRGTDAKTIFHKLTENPTLTVVSMAPVGHRIQGTFYHAKMGSHSPTRANTDCVLGNQKRGRNPNLLVRILDTKIKLDIQHFSQQTLLTYLIVPVEIES